MLPSPVLPVKKGTAAPLAALDPVVARVAALERQVAEAGRLIMNLTETINQQQATAIEVAAEVASIQVDQAARGDQMDRMEAFLRQALKRDAPEDTPPGKAPRPSHGVEFGLST